jgi:hypothetical protein
MPPSGLRHVALLWRCTGTIIAEFLGRRSICITKALPKLCRKVSRVPPANSSSSFHTQQDVSCSPRAHFLLQSLLGPKRIWGKFGESEQGNAVGVWRRKLQPGLEFSSTSAQGIMLATCLEALTIRAVLYSFLHCRTKSWFGPPPRGTTSTYPSTRNPG